MSNIWHDFDKERIRKDNFYAFIEIPKGSKNKYELDNESGVLVLDRVLGTSVQFPANYGFIPKTLAEDSDAIDVFVLCQETIPAGCLVECKPIGVMIMVDDGKLDEKIIAVAVKDMVYSSYNNLAELPKHIIYEIEHFFSVYKAFEKKKITIEGFEEKEFAMKLIEEGLERYEKKYN